MVQSVPFYLHFVGFFQVVEGSVRFNRSSCHTQQNGFIKIGIGCVR